jgi:O-antigen/teichoic acid export membrane protein
MVLAKVAEHMLGLVSTLILVRLLLPADFGLVAMAISMIAVVEIMGAFSFDMVLIYRQDATRGHYDTAWTFNVIVAAAVAVALFALSVPTAQFYGEPRLVHVIFFLALGSLVQGFTNIGVVDFRKTLEFDKEFRFILVKKFISFAVTVPLAFMLRSYWALVIGTVASKFAVVAASFWLHPYRPRLSLAARGDLFNFSKWLLLNNLILLARDRSADFTIGRMLGAHDLGLYSVSREVAELPTQQLTAPVNRAAFPGYAKQAHDLGQLAASFVQVTSVLWVFALPIGAGIAVTAPVLVPVALGANWIEAVPILSVLAVFATLMVMQANIGYVFYALGSPKTTTALTFAYVVMLLPALFTLTTIYGAVGAAWAHLLAAAIFIPISLGVVLRRLRLSPTVFAASVWRTIVTVCVMAIAVHLLLGRLAAAGWSDLAALSLGVITGALTYVAVLVLLWLVSGRPAGPETLLLGTVNRFLSSRLRQRSSNAGDTATGSTGRK